MRKGEAMTVRPRMVWVKVRDSLWFVPGTLTLAAALLAFGLVRVDEWVRWDDGVVQTFLFGGGAEGARGVLNAVAGGLITVTGVVFSVTIVALQLVSSQFTPRVLRNFMADRGNQVVLGVFIGTFTYCILVLRTIRSATEDGDTFVPRLAVTVGVLLALVSIGSLIFFINHAARSMQVSSILERVAVRTLGDVRRLFPDTLGHADPASPADPRRDDVPSAPVGASRTGYLQAVDAEALFRVGRRHGVVIAMEPHMGDFVLAGERLATVSPPEALDAPLADAVRRAFVLGSDRTPEQDVEFGIIEMSDIAVKSLSPGINDPTTAFRCIDRLSEVLLALGTRAPPRPVRTQEGRVHYLARATGFERAVGLAFDQVRHFGAGNPAITKKLLEALGRLEQLVPPSRRGPLREQARLLRGRAGGVLDDPAEAAEVEQAADRMGA